MFQNILLVGAGGFFGAIFRYLSSLAIIAMDLPPYIATLSVNALGSFGMGLLFLQLDGMARPLILIGFFGAFTTFSTFSFESIKLLDEGRYSISALYIFASLALSLLGFLAGRQLSG